MLTLELLKIGTKILRLFKLLHLRLDEPPLTNYARTSACLILWVDGLTEADGRAVVKAKPAKKRRKEGFAQLLC